MLQKSKKFPWIGEGLTGILKIKYYKIQTEGITQTKKLRAIALLVKEKLQRKRAKKWWNKRTMVETTY